MALKFVERSFGNSNFSKLFPLREIKHGMKARKSEKYFVIPSKTKRHKDSAVPYLQNLLNKDHLEKRQTLKRLFDNDSFQVMQKERWLNQKIGWTISVMLMLSPRKIKTYLFIFFLSFSIFSWKKISQKWYLQISVKVNKELSNNKIVQYALNLKAWSHYFLAILNKLCYFNRKMLCAFF